MDIPLNKSNEIVYWLSFYVLESSLPGITTFMGGTGGKFLSSKQQTILMDFLLLMAVLSNVTLKRVSKRAISPCRRWGISRSDLTVWIGSDGKTGALNFKQNFFKKGSTYLIFELKKITIYHFRRLILS